MKNRSFQNLPYGSGVNKDKDNRFYKTIHLTENELTKAKKQAESQETKIFDLLKTYSSKNFTKHEIKEQLVLEGIISDKTPESSISRALSNLKDDGKILKLAQFREGSLGKPNHLWQLKPEPKTAGTQTFLF